MDEAADLQDVWEEEKRAEIEERQEMTYRYVILTYQRQNGGDDDTLVAIQDMITNLLHLGDQYGMIEARNICEAAIGHYEAERAEAGLR